MQSHSRKVLDNPAQGASEVQRQLRDRRAKPLQLLKPSLDEKPVDMDKIVACLEKHWERVKKLSGNEITEYVRLNPVAGVAMNYLLNKHDAWLTFVCTCYKGTDYLCYGVIAEGPEKVMLDWVKVDIDVARAREKMAAEVWIWRGLLFRAAIKARIRNARRTCQDHALATFFDFVESRGRAMDALREDRGRLLAHDGNRTVKEPQVSNHLTGLRTSCYQGR